MNYGTVNYRKESWALKGEEKRDTCLFSEWQGVVLSNRGDFDFKRQALSFRILIRSMFSLIQYRYVNNGI